MKVSRVLLIVALAGALTTGLFANGLNLNGTGGKATGMGGAFVGLANDYSAVLWNPAGLSADALLPSAKYAIGSYSQETTSKLYPAGMLGYFQPIGKNIVVGLGAYTLSGIGAKWNNTGLEEALVYPYPPAAFTPTLTPTNWESFIGSITLAPTIAVKVSDMFYVGASFNINYGFFKIDQWGEYTIVGVGAPAEGLVAAAPTIINMGQRNLNVKGWGFGATFGVLVKPADWISVGASYRTESKMTLKGTTEIEHIDLLGLANESDTQMKVSSPMWLAGGVALKPMDKLTFTFDAQYTNWGKLQEIGLTFTDPYWAVALEGASLELNWRNKTQLRFGAEYDFGTFALRGGYYYDPAPAPDSTMNILTPSFTYNSVDIGFGYKAGSFKLDAVLQYLMGKDRTVTDGAMPGTYQMNILVPAISLSFEF
jgi:long-chain fatty acid transport protein